MNTKLSVATMVNGNLIAPPPFIYAPIILAEILSHGLVTAGHTVDYFGPVGSDIGGGVSVRTLGLTPLVNTEAEYQSAIMNPAYGSHMRLGADDLYLASKMYEQAAAGTYDILHFHHLHVPNALARHFPSVPSVTTIHDVISADDCLQIHRAMTPNSFFVAISETQRRAAPDLPYIGTVYNGIDTHLYRPLENRSEKEEYLLWAARIVPEKGLEDAIAAALATGRSLHIAGPKYAGTQEYFDSIVKPHLFEGSPIQYLGVLNPQEIVYQMQHAYAFLMPIKWEEPFGLTVVEAMACGTPAIAYNRGAMSEIIVDSKTGFLVDTLDEMISAIGRIGEIDSVICRNHVEEKFSLEAMTQGYVTVYQAAIQHLQ